VQVDPIKHKLKAPGTNLLTLEYDELLSTFAFNLNLRRFIQEYNICFTTVRRISSDPVRRCRLTQSNLG